MKRLMSIFTRLVGPGQHQHRTGKRTQRPRTLGPNRTRLGRLEVLEARRMLGLASAMTTSLTGLTAEKTTIDVGSSNVDLAIQGDGFFIVEGESGEQFFTRDGIFKFNSENELVVVTGGQLFTRNGVYKLNAENELGKATGNRVLGYAIDEDFQIQETSLAPLSIPPGNESVAQATENVFLEGTLTPTGDLGDTAEVLQTAQLGSDLYHASVDGMIVSTGNRDSAAAPITDGVTIATGAGGLLTLNGRYRYKFVYFNANTGPEGAEGTPATSSETFGVDLGAAENDIRFNGVDLLTPAGSSYTDVRTYRTDEINGGGDPNVYRQVDTVALGTAGWTDRVADAAWADGQLLDEGRLYGYYTYYMTLANAAGGPGNGLESRPVMIGDGPTVVVETRVRLDNLPVWGGTGEGEWTHRRIYRSLSTDRWDFYYVGEIDSATVEGVSFTDGAYDRDISGNATLDFDGPPIAGDTPLVNILVWDGVAYDHPFRAGTIQFAPRKGGRQLAVKEFTVTATTTALELATFMSETAGIRSIGDDPLNPLPDGDPSAAELSPGTTITADGRFQVVSNNGVDSALDIRSSGLQVELANGTTESVAMPFRSTQTVRGQSAVADRLVYDSLGIAMPVRLTAVLESRDDTSATYRWFADCADNSPTAGAEIGVGTGLITFDGEGNFLSATNSTVSIERRHIASISPLEFDLDFSQISGLYTHNSSLAVSRQDGSRAGTLIRFNIGEDGIVRGVFSNGMTRDLGQIRLARFENPDALGPVGDNLFIATAESGKAVVGSPQRAGFGSIVIEAEDVRVAGDANGDGAVDMIDFALWNANKFTTATVWETGDFNGDGVTDLADLNILRAHESTAAAAPSVGSFTMDLSDLNAWNANKFTHGTDWSTGDFNGDGVTDLSDFNIWNAHKFTSGAMPAPVPLEETDDDGYSEITISELARLHESQRSRRSHSSDAGTLAAQATDRLLATYWS